MSIRYRRYDCDSLDTIQLLTTYIIREGSVKTFHDVK